MAGACPSLHARHARPRPRPGTADVLARTPRRYWHLYLAVLLGLGFRYCACAGSRTAEVLASGTESRAGIPDLLHWCHPLTTRLQYRPLLHPGAGKHMRACSPSLMPGSVGVFILAPLDVLYSLSFGSRSWCLGRCQGCSIYLSSYLAPGALQAWTSSSLGRLSSNHSIVKQRKPWLPFYWRSPPHPSLPFSLGWPRTGHQSRLGPADGFISHSPKPSLPILGAAHVYMCIGWGGLVRFL